MSACPNARGSMPDSARESLDRFVNELFKEGTPVLRARADALGLTAIEHRAEWMMERWDAEGWGSGLGAVGWLLEYQAIQYEWMAVSRAEWATKSGMMNKNIISNSNAVDTLRAQEGKSQIRRGGRWLKRSLASDSDTSVPRKRAKKA